MVYLCNLALHTLTIEAASVLGISDRAGSPEAGKHADIVIFDGDPFEYVTKAKTVVINGIIVHQSN